MKKIICILAGAALLGACEQKTDVAAPAPESKPIDKMAPVNPPASSDTGQKKKPAISTMNAQSLTTPSTSTEMKTEAATAVDAAKTDSAMAVDAAKADSAQAVDSAATLTTTAASPSP